MKKTIVVVLFILVMSILTVSCTNNELSTANKKSIEKYKSDALYMKFNSDFPESSIIVCDKADVTNDNIDDMVVIYMKDNKTFMRVIIGGDKITYTDEVAAPVENQSIEFRDIDKKDELEFIVSGSKKGKIGYAIYRVINNEVIDLFGDGMENCC